MMTNTLQLSTQVKFPVPLETELVLATRLTAATKWMAANWKARCDHVPHDAAVVQAYRRQSQLESKWRGA